VHGVVNVPAVLVTRPAGQADTLCHMLSVAGIRAVHQPLLEIAPLPRLSAASQRALFALDRFDHVIFISTNAVRFGMDAIAVIWPRLPVGPHWYAVGTATARAVAAWSVRVTTAPGAMDSEALLALPALADVAGKRVLLVKGEGGRDQLSTVLTARGALVEELRCYQRRCPALAPGALAALLARENIVLIALSSGEGLQNLLALLAVDELSTIGAVQLVVPGERLAAAARALGAAAVAVADNATDAAMSAAIIAAWTTSIVVDGAAGD